MKLRRDQRSIRMARVQAERVLKHLEAEQVIVIVTARDEKGPFINHTISTRRQGTAGDVQASYRTTLADVLVSGLVEGESVTVSTVHGLVTIQRPKNLAASGQKPH